MKLIEELESHLPIPIYPTEELCKVLAKQGKDVDINMELMITNVFDSGDVGGIVCAISGEHDNVFVASLTHFKAKPDHPLADKISAYQKQRIRRLSRSRGR